MRITASKVSTLLMMFVLVACGGSEPGGSDMTVNEVASPASGEESAPADSRQTESDVEGEPTIAATSTPEEGAGLDGDEGAEVTAVPAPDPAGGPQPELRSQPGLPGYILFASRVSTDSSDQHLYVMRADGSSLERLTQDPLRIDDLDWRGGAAPVVTLANPPVELFLISADGASWVQVPVGNMSMRHISLVPDGSAILFDGTQEGTLRSEIHQLDLGTAEIQMVVDLRSDREEQPTQSADGAYLALQYVAGILSVVEAGSEEPHFISMSEEGEIVVGDEDVLRGSDTAQSRGLAWSPSGRRLAFVYDYNSDDQQICVYDFDVGGAVCHPVGAAPFSPEPHLSWSPDGEYIVFAASHSDEPPPEGKWIGGNLFVLNLASGELAQLTNNIFPASSLFPVWVASWEPAAAESLPGPFVEAEPTATPSFDLAALDAPGAVQALLQARADGDRDTFGALVESMIATTDELWDRASAACVGVDASQFSYVDTLDACCTENIVEYAVYDGEAIVAMYTLRNLPGKGWRIAEGDAWCNR